MLSRHSLIQGNSSHNCNCVLECSGGRSSSYSCDPWTQAIKEKRWA